jgi:hypothetical protein
MPAIHFGISGWAPGAGRLRQLRAASSRKSTPKTILPRALREEHQRDGDDRHGADRYADGERQESLIPWLMELGFH